MTNDEIRDLVLIALASDDELMETLVLKGGNAISLLERDSSDGLSRTSKDLDFSIPSDFNHDLPEIKHRFVNTIKKTFSENGFEVFDYIFSERPNNISEKLKGFWGGYKIEFKIIGSELFKMHKNDPNSLRRLATRVSPQESPRIEIEISKYEYIGGKIPIDVEGYTIFVYTAQMIVFEKLRAICQQNSKYYNIVPQPPRPRSRDFYDIHLICSQHTIFPLSEDDESILTKVFQAKHVPLEFLKDIREESELHRSNWQEVLDTISAKQGDVPVFEYYLNFVEEQVSGITFL